MSYRPYAESCDQNKKPILRVLKEIFTEAGQVLEVGSGTGQHAVFFTEHLPYLCWQPTDMADQLAGIEMWRQEAQHDRIQPPAKLDVSLLQWPFENFDYVFTANTTHIVSWPKVQSMFRGIGCALKTGGLFAQYGPFNYGGRYTSDSNARFDQWLKSRDIESGIRNFEDLCQLAEENGMALHADYEMPANNRILAWKKI
jgi:SAM-dependent methyltransferase